VRSVSPQQLEIIYHCINALVSKEKQA